MSVIMIMGARMTFRLLRGGIWARPARIILLAGSFYYVVRVVDLFDDLFGLLQTQYYIIFNNASSLVFSVLFFIAIYELYRVLKRLTLPIQPDHHSKSATIVLSLHHQFVWRLLTYEQLR